MNHRMRTRRLPRALALGAAVATGGMGIAALGPIPAANASCASFFGIGNSANCTSTFTSIAIALGPNAQAHANGTLGAAISLGDTTSASTGGMFNLAFTHGTNSSTSAGGLWSAALTKAANDTTVTVGPGPLNSGNLLNVAVVLGANSSETTNINIKGVGNLAVGFLSSGDIDADGVGTVTVNSFGAENNLTNHGNFSNVSSFLSGGTSITSNSTLSWAWDVDGASNVVETNGGANVAGAFAQENETVIQNGPGVNVRLRPSVGSSPAKSKPSPGTAASPGGTERNSGTRGARSRDRH